MNYGNPHCSSQGAKRHMIFQDLDASYGSNEGQILKNYLSFCFFEKNKKD